MKERANRHRKTDWMQNIKNASKGFTLIELSIVLLIIGIISIPLLRLYTNYLMQEKIDLTKSNLTQISRAMALFSQLRYPCPSDRSLPPSDPNYGVDVCTLSTFSLATVPLCDTTGKEQGLCKAPGARDTEDDADGIAGNNREFVLIGGVPIRYETIDTSTTPPTINIKPINGVSSGILLDAWNNQFTYAVSYPSTNPSTGFTRFKNGVIKVVDEWNNDTAGTKLDAHFIVISHGSDGSGAYNNVRSRNECDLANVDSRNCDGDSTFVQGLSHYGGTMKYDDYSYVQTDNSANLWQIVTDPDNSNAPTSHILTIPEGDVGINMTTPGLAAPSGVSVRLDVNGTIRADTVRTQQICNKDGTKCLDINSPDAFFEAQKGSTFTVSNDCPDGEVILSISKSKVTCGKAEIKFQNKQILCPPGTWVEQVLTDGSIRCTGGISCPGGTGCVE